MAKQSRYLLVLFLTFFAATGGILFEIFLGAFGSYLFGDSVKIFGLTMGTYMFSMGIGAFAIKPEIKSPLTQLLLVELFLCFLHLLFPIGIWVLFTEGFGSNTLFWVTLIVSGVLVGSEIPLILALLRKMHGTSDAFIHRVLAADYFGALVASLLFSYVLLERLGMLGAAGVSALLEALSGLILVLFVWKTSGASRGYQWGWAILYFLVVLITVAFLFSVRDLQNALENRWVNRILSDAEVVHAEWTGMQQLNLVSFEHPIEKRKSLALFLNRQYQWSTGSDLEEYHELLAVPAAEIFIENFEPSQAQEGVKDLPERVGPRNALILGGGDGFLAKYLLDLYHLSEVTVVDYDSRVRALAMTTPEWRELGGDVFLRPEVQYFSRDAFQYVIELARNSQKEKPTKEKPRYSPSRKTGGVDNEVIFFSSEAGGRSASKSANARTTNKAAEKNNKLDMPPVFRDGLYDLIFFDLPDPTSAGLARFYTPFFFRAVKEILSEKGVLNIQASFTPHTYKGREKYVCSLVHSLNNSGFQAHVLVGDELDFYVLAAGSNIAFPKAGKKLAGHHIYSGEILRAYFLDPLRRFEQGCTPGDVIENHLLWPRLLEI